MSDIVATNFEDLESAELNLGLVDSEFSANEFRARTDDTVTIELPDLLTDLDDFYERSRPFVEFLFAHPGIRFSPGEVCAVITDETLSEKAIKKSFQLALTHLREHPLGTYLKQEGDTYDERRYWIDGITIVTPDREHSSSLLQLFIDSRPNKDYSAEGVRASLAKLPEIIRRGKMKARQTEVLDDDEGVQKVMPEKSRDRGKKEDSEPQNGYDRIKDLPNNLQDLAYSILNGAEVPAGHSEREIKKVLAKLAGCQQIGDPEVFARYRALNRQGADYTFAPSEKRAIGEIGYIIKNASELAGFSYPLAKCRPRDQEDYERVHKEIETFFPNRGRNGAEEAKRRCLGCTAIVDCAVFAQDTNQTFGVWGGISQGEHVKIRKIVAAEGEVAMFLEIAENLADTAAKLGIPRLPKALRTLLADAGIEYPARKTIDKM